MAEKELVVRETRVTYEGLFLLDELHKTIDDWCSAKHYDRLDKMHAESVKPEGKYIDIELLPEKNLDDYTKFEVRVRIHVSHLKPTTVTMDGRKRRMSDGKVQIVIDAFIVTAAQGRMENKPINHFFRTLFDKYVYRTATTRLADQLKEDVNHLKTSINSYLNINKHR